MNKCECGREKSIENKAAQGKNFQIYYSNDHDKSQLQFVYDYESSQCFYRTIKYPINILSKPIYLCNL